MLREPTRYEAYFAELAGLRARVYSMLGSLFLYPGESEIIELAAEAAALRDRTELWEAFPFAARLRVLLDLLESMPAEARLRLEQEYVRLFGVGASQVLCPPYESSYVEASGLHRGSVAVRVDRAYTASGAALVSTEELPDHVAFELAFLAVVCTQEDQAWRENRVEQAAGCLERQTQFHDEHLQRWFPAFSRQVGRAAAPASLYRQVAETARAFVTHDHGLVRVLAEACS